MLNKIKCINKTLEMTNLLAQLILLLINTLPCCYDDVEAIHFNIYFLVFDDEIVKEKIKKENNENINNNCKKLKKLE